MALLGSVDLLISALFVDDFSDAKDLVPPVWQWEVISRCSTGILRKQ